MLDITLHYISLTGVVVDMSHNLAERSVKLFHLGQVGRNIGQGASSPMPHVTGELVRPVVVTTQQVVLMQWVRTDQGVALDVNQEWVQSVGTNTR